MSPCSQDWPSKGSNPDHWSTLKNVKEDIEEFYIYMK